MVAKSSIGTYWLAHGKVSSRWPVMRTKTLIKGISWLTLNAPVSVMTLTCGTVAGWPLLLYFVSDFHFFFAFLFPLLSFLYLPCFPILFSLLLLQLHVASLLQATWHPEPLDCCVML
jgi:hypothetical protein